MALDLTLCLHKADSLKYIVSTVLEVLQVRNKVQFAHLSSSWQFSFIWCLELEKLRVSFKAGGNLTECLFPLTRPLSHLQTFWLWQMSTGLGFSCALCGLSPPWGFPSFLPVIYSRWLQFMPLLWLSSALYLMTALLSISWLSSRFASLTLRSFTFRGNTIFFRFHMWTPYRASMGFWWQKWQQRCNNEMRMTGLDTPVNEMVLISLRTTHRSSNLQIVD